MNDIFRQIAKENGTTEKAAKEEIYNNLLAEGFEVIEPQYTKKMYEDAMFSGSHNMQVILYTTEDFQ